MDGRRSEGENDCDRLKGLTEEISDSKASPEHFGSGGEDLSGTDAAGDAGVRDCECGSVVVYSGDTERREGVLNLSWEADSAW